MRICFFNTARPWGGGEKWHYDFAKLMSEKGHEVFAVTNDPSELFERMLTLPGVTAMKLKVGNTSFLNPFKLFRLARFFRKNRIQAVVMALPSDMKCGGIAARLAGVKDIIYRRGIGIAVKDTFLNRFLFRNVITKLIINSRNTGRTILARNPDMIPQDRVHLVFCGFDVAEFDAMQGGAPFAKEPDTVYIGNAGRLTEQKGQTLLLDAARILKDRGLSFKIVIAGKGELEEELRDKARRLDVEDVVRFLGFVSDMKGFQQSIDIFALSSLYEGFCYVQVEAMTLEKPVVAFNVSSIPEVVADGVTGLLAPEMDVEAFAAHLETLIRDPELRKEMGRKGRQRVIDHFEMRKTLDDFEKVLGVES